MKKIIISLIFFALILSCVACQDNLSTNSSDDNTSSPSSKIETTEASSAEESSIYTESSEEKSQEASSSEETQEDSSAESNAENSSVESSEQTSEESGTFTEISQDELAEIEEFLNSIENNGFISSNYYNSPDEINITLVFYDGAGIKIDSNQWAEGESDAVLSAMNLDEFYVSPFKINYSDADELLKEKCGLSLEHFDNKIGSFTFVEAYNAFYTMRSDTNFMTVSVSDGTIDENGIRKVNYTSSFTEDSTFTVMMKKTDYGYRFISNIKNVTN